MQTVFLDPGMLNARLSLEAPAASPDGQGGTRKGYEAIASLWGKIEPISARSEEIAASLNQRLTHRVIVRRREGLKPEMRFRRFERVLVIKTVADPDETGRYLVCRCEEITP